MKNLALPILLKLSENDKRILIAICLLIILIIVLVGFICNIVIRIMERQGKQVDKMMYDIMRARVITDAKTFKKVAFLKSHRYFMQKSWLPFILMVVFAMVVVIYGLATHDFSFYTKGWHDIWFDLEWPKVADSGGYFAIAIGWPKISRAPNFEWDVGKYLAVTMTIGFSVSALIFLIRVQALIARMLRIVKLKRTYFSKDLNKLAERQQEAEEKQVIPPSSN